MEQRLTSSNFAKLLKKLMKEAGVSGYRMADTLGVQKSTLSRIFRGQTKAPQIDIVLGIFESLGWEVIVRKHESRDKSE